MNASTLAQETLISKNDNSRTESPLHGTLQHSVSLLEPDEFYSLIQRQYGACWGTFKFDDSFSDYSDEVNFY